MHSLGLRYCKQGRRREGLALLEEGLRLSEQKLGPDDVQSLRFRLMLGNLYASKRPSRGLPHLEKAKERSVATLGADHPLSLACAHYLAGGYAAAGYHEKARKLLEETVARSTARLGANHVNTLDSVRSLADQYERAGRRADALPLRERLYKGFTAVFHPDHPKRVHSGVALSSADEAAGNLANAERVDRELLAGTPKGYRAKHADTIRGHLIQILLKRGQQDKAIPFMKEALAKQMAKKGVDDRGTLTLMNNLGVAYAKTGKFDQGLPLLEKTLAKRKAVLGADDMDTLDSIANLAGAYLKSPQPKKALPLVRDFLKAAKKRLDDLTFAGLQAQVGLDLLKAGQFAAAEPILCDSLGIRLKKAPDVWTTFNTQSLLGAALLGQKKYAAAEPLLLKGYEGMKQREKTIPPQAGTRIPEALDRLIELYTALNKPDQAKKWRAQRAKYPSAGAKPAAKK
jgi:tetratricopeptide (TPR) repeat protein